MTAEEMALRRLVDLEFENATLRRFLCALVDNKTIMNIRHSDRPALLAPVKGARDYLEKLSDKEKSHDAK